MQAAPALTRILIWGAASLVLTVAPVSLADGVPPDQATAVQREQAQSKFTKGRKLFEKKKYEQALQELKASHQIVSSPNTRLMIARCLQEMGRLVEAYAEFGRAAVEARELERADQRYAQAAESAELDRKELETKLGFVVVDVRNPASDSTLRVGGEEIKRAAWGVAAPAMPGDTEVVVETPGRPPVRKSVTLSAGQRAELMIDAGVRPPEPEPPPPPPPPEQSNSTRTWAYVAGGIGVAGMATFAVAGLMANGTYSDLEDECGGPCPPDRQDDIDAGRRQQTIANIGLAVGVIGLGTGVALYLSSEPSDSGSAPGPSTAVVVSPNWIGLRGRM
jgi:hypothetical protein